MGETVPKVLSTVFSLVYTCVSNYLSCFVWLEYSNLLRICIKVLIKVKGCVNDVSLLNWLLHGSFIKHPENSKIMVNDKSEYNW